MRFVLMALLTVCVSACKKAAPPAASDTPASAAPPVARPATGEPAPGSPREPLAKEPPLTRTFPGWGEAHDELGDCIFTLAEDKLTIHIPSGARSLDIPASNINAPRVLQTWEGDFVATVKVDGEWPVDGQCIVPGRRPFFGAGLFLITDERHAIRLEKAQYERNGSLFTYLGCEYWIHGERQNWGNPTAGRVDRLKPLWVRLSRTGSTFVAEHSADGKTWTRQPAITIPVGGPVRLGLCASHSTTRTFEPNFSEFKLARPAAQP